MKVFTVGRAGYSYAMKDQIHAILQHTPKNIHADVWRVFEYSQQFAALMRNASELECQQLFVDVEQALLPDASENWIPACDSSDVVTCMAHLRQCKHRAHRHLIWWEMGLFGGMDASCRAIADLASGLLEQAVRMAERLVAPRYGYIEGGSFCVIGLGKLGGRELNLGSDVDPLFVWQGSGSSAGGRQSIPVAEYYMHFSRMLIRLMGERTVDGIVWPVDMRLRPGGDGASITLSLDATVSFYLEYGQTWERAMLIKARPVAGDMALGEAFIDGIAPFIYRRYLDYTTVAALADMKRRIDGQAGSGDIAPGFDVKRGRGGIREIEFIIQSMQLLHGGRNTELRVQPSMQAIDLLQRAEFIDEKDVLTLKSAYRFWRRIEHAIQSRRGEQTHKLPNDYQTYLAAATDIDNVDKQMMHHAAIVERAFRKFIKPIGEEGEQAQSWLFGRTDGFDVLSANDSNRISQALQQIDDCLSRGLLPERSRMHVERILEQAMPRWLDDENGVTALESFAKLMYSISGRATWVDLLATHQGVLDWLIGVLSASRYLADHIVKDPSWLEWPLTIEHHGADIKQTCARLDDLNTYDDVEQTLADIGRGVDQARLLCALAVDAHTADAMTIGAWLADVADAATSAILRLCLYEMGLPEDFPFVALAMGKHGSCEMGLVSDLDMVFILVHEQPSKAFKQRSYGEHAQRLGRRMIQYLSGKPPFGAGFEFDARLRPSGCSGVLVTTMDSFYDYQLHEAQTWEHQALCRARPVAGSKMAKEKVAEVVQSVLNRPYNETKLATDVIEMRYKMLEHLASKSAVVINLKHDAGGLVDIEFLAQYARLVFGGHGRRSMDILNHIPNSAPESWQQQGRFLADTYVDYRQMENALRVELWRSISKLPNDPSATEWKTMRRHAAITTPLDLGQRMLKVHHVFKVLLSV